MWRMEIIPSPMSLLKIKKAFLSHPSRLALISYRPAMSHTGLPKPVPGKDFDTNLLLCDTHAILFVPLKDTVSKRRASNTRAVLAKKKGWE